MLPLSRHFDASIITLNELCLLDGIFTEVPSLNAVLSVIVYITFFCW